MDKQIRRCLAFTYALLGKSVKSCAILAIMVLSIASSETTKASAQIAKQADTRSLAEQTQTAITRRPTAVEMESWRKVILKTPRPKKACFVATYPETDWREVACNTPPHKLYPPRHGIRPLTVGNRVDFSAEVTGHLSESEGSFDSVAGVTSECAVPCPGGICPVNPTCALAGATPNAYSLQLNTEFITDTTAAPCNLSPTPASCQEWEQFVYDTSGSGFIQYWLITYGPAGTSCPSSPAGLPAWSPFQFTSTGDVYCVVNAVNGAPAPIEPISSLSEMKVTATAPGVHSADDSVAITVGSTVYSAPGDNRFPDLATLWQYAEYNVFGDGGGDQAVFNSGSTIVVRAEVASGTTSGPLCAAEGFTGETNNLTLVNTPPAASEGALPALVFSESNPGPGGAPATCADATSLGDTHLTTFDGLYYDFQASGDFVLARNGSDFEVQTRQASGAPTWPNAAVNKAVAMRMGKTRVAIYIEPTRLIIDDKSTDLADGKSVLLPTGVQVSRHGDLYLVSSETGNSVSATLNSTWIDVTVGLGRAPLTETRGLLGNPKGNSRELATSNGVVLRAPVSFIDLYHTYADSWRVQPNESLFTLETTIRPGIPDKPFFASDLDPQASARALTACKAAGITAKELLESCTLDTAVLNDKKAVNVFIHTPPPLHVIKPVLHIEPLTR
jgi:hypothetical protein